MEIGRLKETVRQLGPSQLGTNMEKQLLISSLFLTVLIGLSAMSTKPASAARDLSPYCVGTNPQREVVVQVNDRSFAPSSLVVTEGECIQLFVRVTGDVSHSLMIEGTDITTEGAPLIDGEGRHIARAVARKNASCPTCEPLAEGWFAKGEMVLLRFQVNKPGSYQVKCKRGMQLTIEAIPAPVTFSS